MCLTILISAYYSDSKAGWWFWIGLRIEDGEHPTTQNELLRSRHHYTRRRSAIVAARRIAKRIKAAEVKEIKA